MESFFYINFSHFWRGTFPMFPLAEPMHIASFKQYRCWRTLRLSSSNRISRIWMNVIRMHNHKKKHFLKPWNLQTLKSSRRCFIRSGSSERQVGLPKFIITVATTTVHNCTGRSDIFYFSNSIAEIRMWLKAEVSSFGRGGDARTSSPRNRKNCCRNLVLSSRGIYFQRGGRTPRNI